MSRVSVQTHRRRCACTRALFAALLTLPATFGPDAVAIAAPHQDDAGLRPFRAHYEVYVDGRHQGASTLVLQRIGGGLWRYALRAEGTRGVAALAGFETGHDTEFHVRDGQLRLKRSTATTSALLHRREVVTEFDWENGEARWSGDVKKDRRGPVVLSDDALNAQLLNLALAIDLDGRQPGDVLRYRLLERGRADRVGYRVGARESVEVPYGRIDATPVTHRQPERARVTTVWYAAGLPPTPVRLLQLRDGRSRYELRLSRIETP